jgi:hypothetical protein
MAVRFGAKTMIRLIIRQECWSRGVRCGWGVIWSIIKTKGGVMPVCDDGATERYESLSGAARTPPQHW